MPAAAYVCDALAVGAVVVTAALPSPKSNRYVAIGVVSVSVEPEPSAVATRPLDVTVSFATGGLSGGGGAMVTETVTGADALPAVSVTISVTV